MQKETYATAEAGDQRDHLLRGKVNKLETFHNKLKEITFSFDFQLQRQKLALKAFVLFDLALKLFLDKAVLVDLAAQVIPQAVDFCTNRKRLAFRVNRSVPQALLQVTVLGRAPQRPASRHGQDEDGNDRGFGMSVRALRRF